MKEVNLDTRDGLTVCVNCFEPIGQVKAGVIINSATAVKQQFYAPFADWLKEQGYLVLTFDYRGIGQSQTESPRDSKLTMFAWGAEDINTVILWAKDNHKDLNWHCIGHSVGGQLIGLAEENTSLRSVFCVASQNGYWKNWSWKYRPRLVVIWYILIPILSRFFGYFPGKIMGGENLPRGIAQEWSRWCRNPQFFCDNDGNPIEGYFKNIQVPMHFIAIDDDQDFGPVKAVKNLQSFYSQASQSYEVIESKKTNNKKIGHFGFFRKSNKNELWSKVILWLELNSDDYSEASRY